MLKRLQGADAFYREFVLDVAEFVDKGWFVA